LSSSRPTQPSLSLPRVFGRYALFDHIGKGGMAEIYLARSRTELGGTKLVVVKQILPELAENPSFSELLVTEAKLAARLNHANVVQVTDLGRHDGRLFIAMEYVEGFDLNDLLKRCSKTKTALPLDFSLFIVVETLKGLAYAHRRTDDEGQPIGIVHRDVSPSNVLVSFEGEVKVCDFGIAHANQVVSPRADEAIQGKAGYMSPEHARGEPLDARADVFAAGVILWELLAGRRYYKAAEGRSLIETARRAEFSPLPERGWAEEAELRAIVTRALERDRSDRYPSAQALLRDLEAYIGKAGLIASQLRFGAWLREHFQDETLETRRTRERAVRALESGPLVEITPLPPPSEDTDDRPFDLVRTPTPAHSAGVAEDDPNGEHATQLMDRAAFQRMRAQLAEAAAAAATSATTSDPASSEPTAAATREPPTLAPERPATERATPGAPDERPGSIGASELPVSRPAAGSRTPRIGAVVALVLALAALVAYKLATP
jgi:serine/threonine-protein kinase